jgi:hypothetical protein
MCLSNSYEVLLLEICAASASVNLHEIGKLTIKMQLQNMEIIKWLIKNVGNKSMENQ